MATPMAGGKTNHVIQHMLKCIVTADIPHNIKTDNGPAHTSKRLAESCAQWNIKDSTGIPYNTQGQAIVERAHQNLKAQITKLATQSKFF